MKKVSIGFLGVFILVTIFTFGNNDGTTRLQAATYDLSLTFTANPTSVSSGSSSMLSWDVTYVNVVPSPTPYITCTASGAWSGTWQSPQGEQQMSGSQSTGLLTSSKTYTLACVSQAGPSITKSVTVIVGDTPVINGACGYYHEKVSAQHPTSGMVDPRIGTFSYTSVCDSGSLSNSYPGHTDQGDTWNWACKPPLGGITAYCYAHKSENLSVSASASPSSGLAPLNNVAITADVSGSVTGPITYKLDCTSDGTWEQTITNSSETYTFTTRCNYPNSEVYPVRVSATRGGLTATTNTMVTVNPRSLSLTASANPNYGPAPLNGVAVTANVSGTAIGPIDYKLDCSSDVLSGGIWEQTITNSIDPYTFTTLCNYPDAGLYTVTVEATRSGITRTATTQVTVGENPVLGILVSAIPSSGEEPLNDVSVRVDIDEKKTTATGPIEYKIYCIEGGNLSHQRGNINTNSYTAEALCDYETAGNYTVLVEATRQNTQASGRAQVVVTTLTATCSDGIQNQDETGVDTGGICGGGGGSSCSDGIQNQNETGVDSGGVCDTGGGPSELKVSCSVSPNPARIGHPVTWTAVVTEGGTPPFVYEWRGTNIVTPITTDINTFTKIYSTTGEKFLNVTVRKEGGGGDVIALGSCSTDNSNSPILRVYVNPDLEEF